MAYKIETFTDAIAKGISVWSEIDQFTYKSHGIMGDTFYITDGDNIISIPCSKFDERGFKFLWKVSQ